MITFTAEDKAMAEALEAALKQASIDGVPGTPTPFTSSVMTAAQYEPTTFPGVASTLPRDVNRAFGLAVAYALRTAVPRVPQFQKASLPPPIVGGVIYVHNGTSADLPILAFSDGSKWFRCDTRDAIS